MRKAPASHQGDPGSIPGQGPCKLSRALVLCCATRVLNIFNLWLCSAVIIGWCGWQPKAPLHVCFSNTLFGMISPQNYYYYYYYKAGFTSTYYTIMTPKIMLVKRQMLFFTNKVWFSQRLQLRNLWNSMGFFPFTIFNQLDVKLGPNFQRLFNLGYVGIHQIKYTGF